MEYIYSAMVLYSAGKDITEDAIKAILTPAAVRMALMASSVMSLPAE